MRRACSTAASGLILFFAGTAAAKPQRELQEVEIPPEAPAPLVVATDPVPTPPPPDVEPPEPPYDPPYDPGYDQSRYALPATPIRDDYPRESALLVASAVHGWLSQPTGVESFGGGGALSMGFVQRDGDFPTGVDVAAVMVRGEGGAVYDLSFRIIGSPKLERRVLVPFAAIGLCAGASRIEGAGDGDAKTMDEASWGLALGPSAALGLHGFLSDKLYWRAQAGFLGAGAGLYTADVALGVVVGK